LGVGTIKDLLYHFPSRWEAAGGEAAISTLVPGQEVSLVGSLEKLETKKSWKRKIPISEGYLRDQSGRVKLMWFNQPYIAKMYANDTLVKATGRVTGQNGKVYLANPELQKIAATEVGLFNGQQPSANNELFAVYPEVRGVTSL
jgi:ATP-dependent DNA helicase RecG